MHATTTYWRSYDFARAAGRRLGAAIGARFLRRNKAEQAPPPTLERPWRGLVSILASRRRGDRDFKTLNLALQGGGAHGAFTWGVLDRLLEEGGLIFDGVSGTSAGAVNAVLLAAGLPEGGAAARAKLQAFWSEIASLAGSSAASGPGLDLLSRLFSPYDLNPLDYNPLRDRLQALVDFERLRESSPLRLFVSATDVATGKRRIFRRRELSLDAVLASTSLPHLHHAVKVGDGYYWDGGYSANPAILPLICECRAEDTLIVQLLPAAAPALPVKTPEIVDRVGSIVFNAPLRQEIEMIEQCRKLARDGLVIGGRRHARFRRHRFHHIDATKHTAALAPGSRLAPGRALVAGLHQAGRAAAEEWLAAHGEAVGRRSSVDLAATFL
jgi:NTE family protein